MLTHSHSFPVDASLSSYLAVFNEIELLRSSHASEFSQQAAEHVVPFWSSLHAERQLIGERCCCLKVFADVE